MIDEQRAANREAYIDYRFNRLIMRSDEYITSESMNFFQDQKKRFRMGETKIRNPRLSCSSQGDNMPSVNRIWPLLPELDLFQEAEAKPDTPVVAVVVKGDVDGSVEVLLFVSHTILTIFPL